MASIEKVEETVVREMFVMRYDRAELEERADNPMLFVREIKAVLDGGNQKPLKRPVATAVKRAKIVKKKKPLKVAAVGATTQDEFQCKHCAKGFKSEGWRDRHQASCPQGDIGAYHIERDESAE